MLQERPYGHGGKAAGRMPGVRLKSNRPGRQRHCYFYGVNAEPAKGLLFELFPTAVELFELRLAAGELRLQASDGIGMLAIQRRIRQFFM